MSSVPNSVSRGASRVRTTGRAISNRGRHVRTAASASSRATVTPKRSPPGSRAVSVRSGPSVARERQPEGGRSGFADNVPAFLRNPVKRPAKVAGE